MVILPIGRRRRPRGRATMRPIGRSAEPAEVASVARGLVPRCGERADPARSGGDAARWGRDVARDTLLDYFDGPRPASGRPTSSTTTASVRAATATPRSRRRRGASRPGCTPPGWPRAITPSSGARTAPSGWSPSGAACAPGWWWCRSTPAPRRRSWIASPGWCRRGCVLVGDDVAGAADRRSRAGVAAAAISTGATARRRR